MIVKAKDIQEGDELYGAIDAADDTVTMTVAEVDVNTDASKARILFRDSFIAELVMNADVDCKVARNKSVETKEMVKRKYYLHGPGKDGNWEALEEDEDLMSLKMSEEAKRTYIYTGYEVELDVEVYRNGEVYATHVNKVKLEKPIRI